MLYNLGLNMEAKPYAMGIRIQHNQEMINARVNFLKTDKYKWNYLKFRF